MADRFPVRGLLWDNGSLTKAGIARFVQITDHRTATSGPNAAALASLMSVEPTPEVTTVRGALEIAATTGAAIVCTGVPFDPHLWLDDLHRLVEALPKRGIIIHIPTGAGPRRIIASDGVSAHQLRGVQRCLPPTGDPDSLDQATVASTGHEAMLEALSTPGGDIYLLFSRLSAPTSAPIPRHLTLSAASTVHAIVSDHGVTITNRTPLTVAVTVHLGKHGSDASISPQVTLKPYADFHFSAQELGEFGLLEPPLAVMRQWSHGPEVVYERGTQRIHGVHVAFFDEEASLLGETTFGAPDSLVSSLTSVEIGTAIGMASRTVSTRLATMGFSEDWNWVVQSIAGV